MYRDDFLIPGGMVERGESPRVACEREVLEETGLQHRVGRLLCVDSKVSGEGESIEQGLVFVFDGGVLSSNQLEKIKLNSDEHSSFILVSPSEAETICTERTARRLPHCLAVRSSGSFVYLENGKLI